MYDDPERSRVRKRSLTLEGHRTSVSLEEPFWEILVAAAQDKNIPLSKLVSEIDEQRRCGLSTALRLFALGWVQGK